MDSRCPQGHAGPEGGRGVGELVTIGAPERLGGVGRAVGAPGDGREGLAVGDEDEAGTAAIPRRPAVFLGLNVQDLTPEIAERFKLKEEKGVIVTKVEPGSAAEAEGLKEGDLIKEVNREKVNSTDEFKKIMEKTKKTEAVLLRISRENRAFFIVLKPNGK